MQLLRDNLTLWTSSEGAEAAGDAEGVKAEDGTAEAGDEGAAVAPAQPAAPAA